MSVLMRCLRALDFLPEILVQIAIRKQIKKNDGTYLTYRWMGTARELLFRDSGTATYRRMKSAGTRVWGNFAPSLSMCRARPSPGSWRL